MSSVSHIPHIRVAENLPLPLFPRNFSRQGEPSSFFFLESSRSYCVQRDAQPRSGVGFVDVSRWWMFFPRPVRCFNTFLFPRKVTTELCCVGHQVLFSTYYPSSQSVIFSLCSHEDVFFPLRFIERKPFPPPHGFFRKFLATPPREAARP